MDFGRPVKIDEVRLHPNGDVEFISNGRKIEPVQAWSQTTYERQKGDKVLVQSPVLPNALTIDPQSPLTKFDRVFSVDTNTKIVQGERVSVGAVYCCQKLPDGQYQLQASAMEALASLKDKPLLGLVGIFPVMCLEFRHIQEDVERHVWWQVMHQFDGSSNFDMNWKIAIAVDAHLNDILDLNARRKPIYGQFYLPENVELIYASADAGKTDNVLNLMIYKADATATELLSKIESDNNFTTCDHSSSVGCCTYHRFWHVTDSEFHCRAYGISYPRTTSSA